MELILEESRGLTQAVSDLQRCSGRILLCQCSETFPCHLCNVSVCASLSLSFHMLKKARQQAALTLAAAAKVFYACKQGTSGEELFCRVLGFIAFSRLSRLGVESRSLSQVCTFRPRKTNSSNFYNVDCLLLLSGQSWSERRKPRKKGESR